MHRESQKSANSLAHFSDEEMCSGSSSYVSKLLGSPGPFVFGKNGASTCDNVVVQQHDVSTDWQWYHHHHFIYATADEADAYMFYRCFFSVFFVSLFFVFFRPSKNTRQPFSGTAERIFI